MPVVLGAPAIRGLPRRSRWGSAIVAGGVSLAVVPEQRVFAVDVFQAVEPELAGLAGPPPGVAVNDVDSLEKCANVFSRVVAVGNLRAETGQVIVELTDHRFGYGLAEVVLAGVLDADAMRTVAGEAGRQAQKQTRSQAVIEQHEERADDISATLGRRQLPVPEVAHLPDAVDHSVDIGEPQPGKIHAAARPQRESLRRDHACQETAPQVLTNRLGVPRPLHHQIPQPRLRDLTEVERAAAASTTVRGANRVNSDRSQIPDEPVRGVDAAELIDGAVEDPVGFTNKHVQPHGACSAVQQMGPGSGVRGQILGVCDEPQEPADQAREDFVIVAITLLQHVEHFQPDQMPCGVQGEVLDRKIRQRNRFCPEPDARGIVKRLAGGQCMATPMTAMHDTQHGGEWRVLLASADHASRCGAVRFGIGKPLVERALRLCALPLGPAAVVVGAEAAALRVPCAANIAGRDQTIRCADSRPPVRISAEGSDEVLATDLALGERF